MIKAFLFDIGNVLVKFDHAPAVAKIQAHSEATAVEIRDVVTQLIEPLETGLISSDEFLHQAMHGIGYRGPAAEFAEAYCNIFQLNEPMWELVANLAERYPLYLFSNTSELHLGFLNKRYPQMARFTDGIYSMRVGAMKPDRVIYQAALDLLQVAPEEIFFIDDLEPNIAAGQAHGFQTHRYLWQQHEALLAEVGRVL
jgi:HAD superfamily hydrolase (TIGR01509 family)